MTKLSICFPVYDDFDGLYFSVTSLMLYQGDAMRECEIVVADNNPGSGHGKAVKQFCGSCGDRVRYVNAGEQRGVAFAKGLAVKESKGKFCLVLDSHVQLGPNVLKKALDYIDSHGDSSDFLTGPLVMCGGLSAMGREEVLTGGSFVTHQETAWRGGALGTWARKGAASSVDDPCFPIPQHGSACFLFNRDKWPGYNPKFVGFGGLDYYLCHKWRHLKIGEVLCAPWLRWAHRFPRPSGVPYPLKRYEIARNYILGHAELGMPLDDMHRHYVADKKYLTQEVWDKIVEADYTPDCPGCDKKRPKPHHTATVASMKAESLEDLYARSIALKMPGASAMPWLRTAASKCEAVSVVGNAALNGVVALLAARPKRLCLAGSLSSGLTKKLVEFADETEFVVGEAVEPCSLLFAATDADARIALEQHDKTDRFLAVVLDDPEPLRAFLKANPSWSVLRYDEAAKLFLLGKRDEDRPKVPAVAKMAWNYAAALLKHGAKGMKTAAPETVQARLDMCLTCPHRTANRCSVCGCFLDEAPTGADGKALWADSVCPIGKW